MNKYPILSIIIPNYNNETYIDECIHSVLQQSYTNYEIIITDDASDDSSSEIIQLWTKKYPEKIRSIFHPINIGVSQNRNEAIRLAKGDYVMTLDSDDILYNHRKIELEMKLIKFYKEVFQRDICAYSDTLLLDASLQNEKLMTPGRSRKEGNILFEILTRSCFIPTNFIFPKKIYFEVGGYDSSLSIFEDWDLKIRLASKLPFYFTGIQGYGYRRHGTGLSSSQNQIEKRDVLDTIFTKNLVLLKSESQSDGILLFKKFMNKKYTST